MSYGTSVTLDATFADAVSRVRAALQGRLARALAGLTS